MKCLLLLLLPFNTIALGEMPCSNTGGEISSFTLDFTVPFERESNQPMVLTNYHQWIGLRPYVNGAPYDFGIFPVTGSVMSIKLWTQCKFNQVYLTLTDIYGIESVPSNEVIIDYTAPKTGIVECQPI